jgi:hypothetical protein
MKDLSRVGVTANQLRAARIGLNDLNRNLAARFAGVSNFLQPFGEQQRLRFRWRHGLLAAEQITFGSRIVIMPPRPHRALSAPLRRFHPPNLGIAKPCDAGVTEG